MVTTSNAVNAIRKAADANSLINAFNKAKRETGWKESVQRFEASLLLNVCRLQRELLDGSYSQQKTENFILHERGRARLIRTQPIRDRVVQRSFNDSVLEPLVIPKLIYDNYASIKKRGTSRARKRFAIHLQKAFREYGEKGAVIKIDFSKYFDNILHRVFKEQMAAIMDGSGVALIEKTLDGFKVDVSYLSEQEFQNVESLILNCVQINKLGEQGGEKMASKSLAVGFHISQIGGIYYPHRLDNFIKIVKGVKYYGRYMDDLYAIVKDREEARRLLQEIGVICKDLGIFINAKKTAIEPLGGWHCFLKINHKVTPTGKVVRKIHSATIRRAWRRLGVYRRLVDEGRMDFATALNGFKGWLGTYRKFDSGYKIKALKEGFKGLFRKEMAEWTKRKRCSGGFMN